VAIEPLGDDGLERGDTDGERGGVAVGGVGRGGVDAVDPEFGDGSRDLFIAREGGETIAAASLVDRSNGAADLGVPFFPLIRLDVPSYSADDLPPELAAIPAIKPGSRAAA
jgi:hypothetical protein